MFVLNGSFTGAVLKEGEYLLLRFSRGSLTDIQGPTSLRSRLIDLLSASTEPASSQIGELGIGVNAAVQRLTGCTLIDEKCAGTVHIAIGDNVRYGGRNSSTIHEDLITKLPTLEVDGKLLLERGEYRFRASDWYRRLDEVEPDARFRIASTSIRRTLVRAVQDCDGGLRVERSIIAERLCRYKITQGVSGRTLWEVYRSIPTFPTTSTIETLIQSPGEQMYPNVIHRALTVLLQHKLIEVVRGNT